MSDHLATHIAAAEYLSHDAHRNRELLLALAYEPVSAVHVARRNDQVVGALVRGPGPVGLEAEWLRLDADTPQAVADLLTAELLSTNPIVSVHRPWLAKLLAEAYALVPTGDGVYGYLVDRRSLQLRFDPAVRLLEPDDERLVERSACGWSRTYFARLFDERRRPWAVVKDGAIVCRASSGYPDADSEEVIGVWTHPGWRGRGLAQALVAAVAADILQRAPFAAYTTTFSNAASQAVARAVGFERAFAAVSLQRSDAHSAGDHARVAT